MPIRTAPRDNPRAGQAFARTNALGGSRVLLVIAGVLAACPDLHGQSTNTPIVGVETSESLVWVYHRRPEPNGDLLLHFASRSPDDPPGAFVPLLRSGLEGAVVRAAALGDTLHVIYRDGTHWRYLRLPPRPRALAGEVRHIELNLGKNVLPMGMAADQQGQALLALITARQASSLLDRQRGFSPGPNRPDSSNDNAAELQEQSRFAAPTVLMSYLGNRWSVEREGPAELAVEAEVVAMLAAGGRIDLVYRPERERPHFLHQFSTEPESWSQPEPVPTEVVPAEWAGGWIDAIPALLLATRQGDRLAVRSLRLEEGGWVRGPVFSDAEGETRLFSPPIGMDIFRGDAVVAAKGDDENIAMGRWSLLTGELLEDGLQTPTWPAGRSPSISRPTIMLIQFAVIGALLMALLLWRRGTFYEMVPLGPTQRLAPLSLRAVGFLLDLLVLLPFWGLAFYGLVAWEGMTIAELSATMASSEARELGAVGLFLPAVGGIFAIYGFLLETIMGSTVGKRVLGLYVLEMEGRTARWGRVLARNVVRVVEFAFPPLLLLVGLTPNRQRIGDIVARTVVIADDREGTRTSPLERPEESPREDGSEDDPRPN